MIIEEVERLEEEVAAVQAMLYMLHLGSFVLMACQIISMFVKMSAVLMWFWVIRQCWPSCTSHIALPLTCVFLVVCYSLSVC